MARHWRKEGKTLKEIAEQLGGQNGFSIGAIDSAVKNFYPQLASRAGKMEKLPARIKKYQPEGGNFWLKKPHQCHYYALWKNVW